MDIHDVDRDTKPYESVQVDQLDTDALLSHLLGLADEMTAATTEKAYVEMHHLEIALTKARYKGAGLIGFTKQAEKCSFFEILPTELSNTSSVSLPLGV